MIPIPSVPLEWIALKACGTAQSEVEHTLEPGVTAFILYPTLADDCSNLLPAQKDHISPVLMIADLQDAEQLVSIVEQLASDSTLMAKISNDARGDRQTIVKERDLMEVPMDCIAETSDDGPRENLEQARSQNLLEKREVGRFHRGHPFISEQGDYEGMTSSFRLPRLLETERSEASSSHSGEIALASSSKQHASDATTTGPPDRDGANIVMVSTSYTPQSSNPPFSRHVMPQFALHTANDDTIPGSTMEGPEGMTMVTAAAASTPACSRSRGKARAEAWEESTLSVLSRQPNTITKFDDGQCLRARRIAQPPPQAGTGVSTGLFSSSRLAYISGKIVLVLMSTICLTGVIMFGALLFVVAVKVRLFRTHRSSSNLYSHSARLSRNGHHLQNQPLGRNLSNSICNKKVVPQHVLETFKVQTVVKISPTSVDLSAAVTPRRFRTKREKGEVSKSARTRHHERSEVQVYLHQQVQERRSSSEGPDRISTPAAVGGESEKGNGEDISDEDDAQSESDVEVDFNDEESGLGLDHSSDAEQNSTASVTSRGPSRQRTSSDRQGSPDSLSSLSEASADSNDFSSSSHRPGSLLSDTSRGATERSGHERANQRRRPRVKQEPLELPFANANAQTACSICLTEYEAGEQIRTLPCFHQYHQGCIDPWLLYVVSLCPMCKRDLHPTPSADELREADARHAPGMPVIPPRMQQQQQQELIQHH
ncbi:unnamed protein product [Mortierella alpina]